MNTQPEIRQWYISRAVESFTSLDAVLMKLTETEVLHALDLESKSQRRQTILTRLIQRAVRLKERSYAQELKEKYGNAQPLENPRKRIPE